MSDCIARTFHWCNSDCDIWEYNEWGALQQTRAGLQQIKTQILGSEHGWEVTIRDIIVQWHQLANLATMYEEICREWFLPKMISLLTSYPAPPEIIKAPKK